MRLKVQNAVHRGLLRVSGGRVGTTLFGLPTLELVTIGRRSGRRRSVMLFAAVVDDDTLVVVGSRAGDVVHPDWLWNLRDAPLVEVALRGGPLVPMLARVATARERERLWPRVTAAWSGFERFQRRTSREIPLVLLTPAG